MSDGMESETDKGRAKYGMFVDFYSISVLSTLLFLICFYLGFVWIGFD